MQVGVGGGSCVLLGFHGQRGGPFQGAWWSRGERHPPPHYFRALFMFPEVLLPIVFKAVAPESEFPLAVRGPALPSPASLLHIELRATHTSESVSRAWAWGTHAGLWLQGCAPFASRRGCQETQISAPCAPSPLPGFKQQDLWVHRALLRTLASSHGLHPLLTG